MVCRGSGVCFYLMECYEHNPFAEVRVGAQLFNIFLFELIGWMLYFLTGRMCFASRVLYGLAVAFGITNHYVMKFRSTPFVPWDLFSAGTAASVAGNYDFTPDRRMVIVTLVFIALFVLTRLFKKARFSWKIRLGVSYWWDWYCVHLSMPCSRNRFRQNIICIRFCSHRHI